MNNIDKEELMQDMAEEIISKQNPVAPVDTYNSPDFISVSVDFNMPSVAIQSCIRDPDMLKVKLDMLMWQSLYMSKIGKLGQWDLIDSKLKEAEEKYKLKEG